MESVDFSNMRRAMVDSQLRTSGVMDSWVLAAMGRLPRESFVPAGSRETAYMDRSIAVGGGHMLNPPVATALMLQAAAIDAGDKVLLIGTPNGYMATLLAGRAGDFSVTQTLAGLPAAAENGGFTLIMIDGAVEEIPVTLIALAIEDARIVTGINERGVTRLATGRVRGGTVALRPFADSEIAILPEFARKPEFVF